MAEFGARQLVADLLAAFERFLVDGARTDPKCWAKNAIAEALVELGHRDPAVFLRGLSCSQPEPVWGGSEDSAVVLRGICAQALVQCDIDGIELLERLIDLLGDAATGARVNAVRAIAAVGGSEAALLLRLKAIDGDADSEVVGECLVALLDIAPAAALDFVTGFLDHESQGVALEAVAALGRCREPRASEVLIDAWGRTMDPQKREAILYALGVSIHDTASPFLLATVARGGINDAAIAIRVIANGRLRERNREKLAGILAERGERKLAQIFKDEFERA